MSLSEPTAARPSFVPAHSGRLAFTLWVHDGSHRSWPAAVEVTVQPRPDEPRPPVGGAAGQGCDCRATSLAPAWLAGFALLVALRRRRR